MQINDFKRIVKENPIPIGIFLFAFLVRLIYIIEFKGTLFMDCLTVDSKYYHDWAMRIADGDFVGSEAFEMTPLYAYLLGVFYKIITTDLFVVRLAQIIVGSASCVLIYRIGKFVLENKFWALLTGLIAAIYGPFIFFDAMVMKPFLAVFFVLLAILYLLRIEEPGWKNALLGAIFLALTALVRENIILLFPIIPIWILRKQDNCEKWKKVLFFFIGLFIIILPVTLRNYYVSGEVVPITSGGGEVFYIGNNAEADGTYKSPSFVRPNPEFEHEDFRRKARELTGRELTRKESSKFWYGEGLKFIMSNPTPYMDLTARKFLLFWNFYEHADNQNYYFHRLHSYLLSAPVLGYGIIAPFGLLGFFLTLRRRREFGLLHLTLLAYMFSVMIVFNFARFRLPAVPLLIVFGVYAIRWFTIQALEKKVVYIGVTLYVLVIFFIVSNNNMLAVEGPQADPYKNKFDVAYTSQGICNVDAGNLEQGIDAFKKALEINPTYPGALIGLGTAYLRKNETDLAYETNIQAVKADPDSAYAHNGLAESLLLKNDAKSALIEFKHAVELDPYNPLFISNVGYLYNSVREYAPALKAYELAKKVDSEYADIYFGLAIAQAGMGKRAEALKSIKEFIAMVPEGKQRQAAVEYRERLKQMP